MWLNENEGEKLKVRWNVSTLFFKKVLFWPFFPSIYQIYFFILSFHIALIGDSTWLFASYCFLSSYYNLKKNLDTGLVLDFAKIYLVLLLENISRNHRGLCLKLLWIATTILFFYPLILLFNYQFLFQFYPFVLHWYVIGFDYLFCVAFFWVIPGSGKNHLGIE